MININQIGQKDKYNYRFPTIDFKFQNTGTAAAFLWQFEINVISVEINLAPVLNFSVQIEDNSLQIIVVNYGWGTVNDFEVELNSPVTNRLFSPLVLRYKGTIKSGKKKVILSLTKALADPNQFRAISSEFTDHTGTYIHPHPKVRGIPLEKLGIKWSGKDDRGIKYSGEQEIGWRWYFLTEEGFFAIPLPGVQPGPLLSDTTFITFVDLSKSPPYEQKYPISRRIPPGDIERFHIMIGAKMSCLARIQFKFYIDEKKVLASEEFEIQVWNPVNSAWDRDYIDGDALKRGEYVVRDIPELDLLGEEFDNWYREFLKTRAHIALENLKSQLANDPNYPFTNKQP